ncbi:hypothetical protein ACIQU4_15610 [Streptomyces sp. NPDC090741]|uniref:hypothetical protein n=1 Tax=Streptomyces sp. NPDC090741 TaxID=3365967 RepID=UPI0037F914CA
MILSESKGIALWTVAQAAAAVGITSNAVNNWVRRGVLAPAADASGRTLVNGQRRPLYWANDVREAEAKTRSRGRRNGSQPLPEPLPDGIDLSVTLWTATESGRYAGVTPNTVHNWRYRGHFEIAGRDDRDHPLFRAIDVIRAEKATRERAHRSYTP